MKMLTPFRYVAYMAVALGAIVCIVKSAYGGDPISMEIIQQYREAGGIPGKFRSWGGNDDDLPGHVSGFVFTEPPTGELPAVPVPFGLSLHPDVFYSDLPFKHELTGTDLTAFRHLENLSDLSLELGGTADEVIVSQVRQFKKLKHLRLSARITDDNIADVVRLKSLESLSLNSARVTDKAVARLSTLKNLKALDLSQAMHVKGTGFERDQEFQNLSILILADRVNDEGLMCVGRLKQLRILRIHGCASCTDVGFSELGNLRKLETLELPSSRVSDVGLTVISRIKGLRHLDVGSATISDDGLRSLANLRELGTLDLSLCRQLTDLRPLSSLRELRTLTLTYCEQLTDGGFENIDELHRLSYLWLPGVPITDGAVKDIAKLKNLQTLSLWGTEVTDECVDDLATIKSLRELYVDRTKVSESGMKRLRALLPNCEIQ